MRRRHPENSHSEDGHSQSSPAKPRGWLASVGWGTQPSAVAVLLLALLGACSSSSASTATGERLATQAAPAQAQQVVQRIEPGPEQPVTGNLQEQGVESPRGAGGASAKLDGKAEGPRPEAITSRHLEAELNRLEDELKR